MGDIIKLRSDDTLLEELLATPSIIDSICNWNAARYEQVPSHELTMELLEEELDEVQGAYIEGDKVAIIDGYGDVFYVAIGALWKTGLNEKQITQLMDNVGEKQTFYPDPELAFYWYCKDVQNHILCILAHSCLKKLELLLNSEDAAYDVIRAICNSNNTKTPKKTASNVKANIDKGQSYIPPTVALEAILRKAGESDDKPN